MTLSLDIVQEPFWVNTLKTVKHQFNNIILVVTKMLILSLMMKNGKYRILKRVYIMLHQEIGRFLYLMIEVLCYLLVLFVVKSMHFIFNVLINIKVT